jgi:Short C-terminal domain
MGFVRRRTRRRTALVVGGAAYAMGKSRGKNQVYEDQNDQGYDEPPPAPPPPAPSAGDSQTDELQRLANLHSQGVLTDEEFAAAKAKVLGL